LGKFNFVKVAGADVWFGNWSENLDGSGNYQAYYVGDKKDGVTLPTQQAEYTVVGLNNGSLLNGTLTANFGGNNQLEGTISNGTLSIEINATIDDTYASFSGSAKANGGGGNNNGLSHGHFFGNDAASLAGIADFENDVTLNTAFGGTKNLPSSQ